MTNSAEGRLPTLVLVVEDNPMDVLLLRYTFEQETGWPTEIIVAEDGEEAIDLLLNQKSLRPDLVILDLNLPKREGTEVLQTIRLAENLCTMPVIIFSSSPEDVSRSRVGGANVKADCYFTKPLGIDAFTGLARRFKRCYEKALVAAARGGAGGEPTTRE